MRTVGSNPEVAAHTLAILGYDQNNISQGLVREFNLDHGTAQRLAAEAVEREHKEAQHG